MEPCIQEKEIRRIVKIIEGNGQPGLMQRVIELSTTVENIHSTVNKIDERVGTLLDFKAEIAGADKQKKNNWTNASIIASIAAVIVTIILKWL